MVFLGSLKNSRQGDWIVVDVIEFNDVWDAVDKIADRLPFVSGKLRSLVEERVGIKKLEIQASSPDPVYAVDSAFPSSPLDLVGMSMSIIAVAVVMYSHGKTNVKRSRKMLVEFLGELDQDYVAALARIEERRHALSVVDNAEMLVIDGEILPRRGSSDLWPSVEQLSIMLVKEAIRRGIPLVGVLKRSYSRHIANIINVSLSDKAIASLVLRRGEYIEVKHNQGQLAKLGCKIVFYKPLRGLAEAVKLEICSRAVPVEDVVAVLAREAGPTGLPWLIDLVDSIVKKEVVHINAVHGLLLARLARARRHSLVYHANPQEKSRTRLL
ncbi:hypothetical protein Pdsh_05010 [Pyrodictium delaneyi]|uniref:NurA domain-containing protein n=1 Tax=Pyrodictium delaneyi TaxID=1273541 RepID=A0A211YPR6_9CREN|nr:hypothetical protein Pdsh_05010 [Pyrodictium delaneyi]